MLARNRTPAAHPTGARAAAASRPASSPPNVPPSTPSGTDEFPFDTLTAGFVHIGMTVHEAQMYHTLLRQGPSTARSAILHSRLDRATGYRILSRLRARGLVTASGYRPQRFIALDAVRLLDRVSSILRDELEMHRIVREIYAAGLPPPRDLLAPMGRAPLVPTEMPRPVGLSLAARYRLLPGHEPINAFLRESLSTAKEEVGGLLRPQAIPEPFRHEIAQAIVGAVQRGIRLRLVLDYHPADLDFLTSILREIPEPTPTLEVRFYAPQLARLFLVDRRLAMRCLGAPGCPFHGPDIGILSEELEFVRVQGARFQTTWREAVPLETALRSPQGSVLAPPSSSRELRHWVERLSRTEPRGYPSDPLGFAAHRTFR